MLYVTFIQYNITIYIINIYIILIFILLCIYALGDLIPWTIAQQYNDSEFASLSGARIVRIATHPGMCSAYIVVCSTVWCVFSV